MVVFSSDIDWAPEEVIDDTLELFSRFGVKCTFFATHDSKALKSVGSGSHEIGIHPNFNNLLNGTAADTNSKIILEKILEIYPEAKGVRSHSMTQSTPLLNLFKELALTYESNHFLPYQHIAPHKLWNGLIRIPYNWEDDIHWMYGHSFNDLNLDYKSFELLVLDFHPVHIFLNTENEHRYNDAKKHYHHPKLLKSYVNTSRIPGARDLLINLLSNNFFKEKSFTISELIQHLQL